MDYSQQKLRQHQEGSESIPSSVDIASSHTGKVSQEMKKTKQMKGFSDKNWSPMLFEEVANEIDNKDNQLEEKQGHP